MLPSAGRLAATGLAIAALVILALAALALVELEREAELHREVIEGMHAKDSLQTLRTQLIELSHAARILALTDQLGAAQAIERRAVEAEAELGYLAQHAARDGAVGTYSDLKRSVGALALQARSIGALRTTRGAEAARAAAESAEGAATEAMAALERMLEARANRINQRTLDQIRVGETLRSYVSWLLAGSVVVLVGLFAVYRWAAFREREAQRRIAHLAHFDTVTGLPNRALLADRLDQEVARAQRAGGPFAVVMFDLDGFKQVNDTWGHAAGDRVLGIVGERSRLCVRASDTVGRLGGDEFMAILPETDHDGASRVAEKILSALAQPFDVEGGQANLSASAGLAIYPVDGTQAEALRRAADGALYEAKRAGKNLVRATGTAKARDPAPTPA